MLLQRFLCRLQHLVSGRVESLAGNEGDVRHARVLGKRIVDPVLEARGTLRNEVADEAGDRLLRERIELGSAHWLGNVDYADSLSWRHLGKRRTDLLAIQRLDNYAIVLT